MAEVATRMLAQLAAQDRQMGEQQALAQRRDAQIKFKDAELERLNYNDLS